uniref:kelch-like protein 3 n=1 Tax=Styela clava TaxID=7725 RepID=UPI001939F92D|nr:kelch-like protein 3 [Styela clava]
MIKVGKEEFHVHRNILSAASPYFNEMLSNDTKGKQDGYMEVNDLDLDVVKQCVDFINTGKVVLTMDKIENLIFAADLWKLCDLVDTCSEYLLDNLSVGNCIQFANLTQAYNQKDSKQDIPIIKLEELSNDFIRENVKTEPLMNESMECKDLLIDAMLETRSENLEIQNTFLQEVEESNEIDENEGPQPYFVVLREESRILHKFNCNKKIGHRLCVTFKGFIYVIDRWKTSSYSLEENTWTEYLEGCGLGRGFAVTTSDSYIYAMGGEETSKQAEEFDINTKKWEPITSMRGSKHFCSAIWFNNNICVLGGYIALNSKGYYVGGNSSSEAYTDSVDSWSSINGWNLDKQHTKAFIIKQEIYLIGDSNYVTVLFMSGGKYEMKNIDVGGNCSSIACLIYK